MTRISNDGPFLAGEVEVLRATEKAIQVRSLRKEKTEWVPQSCVHDDSEVWKAGDKGKLIVKMWFAEAQGWVDGKPAPTEERVTRCSKCPTPIRWKKTAAGKNTPENIDGTPHWATCPAAKTFREVPR